MAEPGDPLRGLWDAVAAPPPHRALADEDAETRAAVDWLRRAYARVAPAAAPARRAARPAARSQRRWPRLLAAPAAAAALLLLARALFFDPGPAAPSTLPVAAGAASAPAPASPEPPPAAPVPGRAPGVQLLASDPARVEMRSGSVRLILLHPRTEPNS